MLGETRALMRSARPVLSCARRGPGSSALRRGPGSQAACAPGAGGGDRTAAALLSPVPLPGQGAAPAALPPHHRRCAAAHPGAHARAPGFLRLRQAGVGRVSRSRVTPMHPVHASGACNMMHITRQGSACAAEQSSGLGALGAAVGAVELRVSCNALLTPSSLPRRHVKGAIARRALSAALSCARGCGARPPQAEASWRGRAQT
jgi:hypothetical protein